ncbi:hypothetical protein KC318_g2342 [Hortaea werneckii]|nr:hypothetical protein KC334_g1144 [Hortaea werneckii]KAI7021940.1 hypothetical protein KC355_g2222 [Hortaea werneckii]KAI7673253.1 hypothetical protein KC318_g2342 [Hortaea werneckii]
MSKTSDVQSSRSTSAIGSSTTRSSAVSSSTSSSLDMNSSTTMSSMTLSLTISSPTSSSSSSTTQSLTSTSSTSSSALQVPGSTSSSTRSTTGGSQDQTSGPGATSQSTVTSSSSVAQTTSSSSSPVHGVNKLGKFDDIVYSFEHFAKWCSLIIQHYSLQLNQFDSPSEFNALIHFLKCSAKHNGLVNHRDIFNILQLTFILNVFELIFIFLRGINILPLIYEQLNQQSNHKLVSQLVFQLNPHKKLHIITHEQSDDKSKPHPDI